MSEYLDRDGLAYLWGKIKSLVDEARSIPFATVDATSTSTNYTVTVAGITELKTGTCILVKNDVVTSASGCKLNVNNLGAKSMYSNLNGAIITTRWTKDRTFLFIFDSTIDGWVEYDGFDSNDNTLAYRIRRQNGSYKSKTNCGRYKLLFTIDEEYLLPTTTVLNSTATTKTLTTLEFDPFGIIYYYASTTTVNADASFGASYLYSQFEAVDIRQSFNTGSTLTSNNPVYLVADIQTSGKAKLASNPISQILPTTNDGHIYIYLGRAYSTYQIQLDQEHPIYVYKDGRLRPYCDPVEGQGGHTIEADVPADAVFTDTIYPLADTYTDILWYGGGFITQSGKGVYFTLPFPGADQRDVSITCTQLRVRKVGGYAVENATEQTSGWTFSYTPTPFGINVIALSTSVLDSNQNLPVGVQFKCNMTVSELGHSG